MFIEHCNIDILHTTGGLVDTESFKYFDFQDLLIISDLNYQTTDSIIELLKNGHHILHIEYSNTVEICQFSYWVDGNIIRELTEGVDDFTDIFLDVKDEIPPEVYQKISRDVNTGKSQWFEKQGSDHESIINNMLKKYNVDMEWTNLFDMEYEKE